MARNEATGSAVLPGFNSVSYGGNDDGTYPCGTSSDPVGCSPQAVSLPFSVTFFGHTYDSLYVNNNGNLTFDAPLSTYTPFPLSDPGSAIIAPFFADVDTRVGNHVTFGQGEVDGHEAFGVNWPGVGCYFENNRQLNNFQVILIDRSDLGSGDFDIEFNYDTITWDSGTASGGDANCLHGSAARVGYAGGSGATGTYFEVDGSGERDALLDSNADTGLVNNSIGSDQLGHYVFPVRGGRPTITNGAPFKDAAVGEGDSGRHNTICNTGDPVNCSSGNLFEASTDISIHGLGYGLSLRRAYNSLLATTRSSLFGFGWSSSYGMNAVPHPDGSVDVTSGDGSQLTAVPDGHGGYIVPAWANSTLARNDHGGWTFVRDRRQVFTFDASGLLTSISDLNGDATTLQYDHARLVSVRDASGRTLALAYGSNGLVSRLTGPDGATTSYVYNGLDDLTTVTDPMNRKITYTYSNHLLTSWTVQGGATMSITYDGRGRVVSEKDALGRTATWSYVGDGFTADGGTTTYTDPAGNVERQTYVNGELVDLTQGVGTPVASTWHYTYDPTTLGRISVTDPNGQTWAHTYDSDGNATSVSTPPTEANPTGAVTKVTYNEFDEPLSTTGPDGIATTFTYDTYGNLLSDSRPLSGSSTSRTITYRRDSSHPSEVTRITDPDGNSWTLTYNDNGDLISATNPNGDTQSFSYDINGHIRSETTPRGNASGADPGDYTYLFAYNAAGQLAKQTDPLDHVTTYDYDPAGRLVATTNPNGQQTTVTYDAAGEITRVTQPDGTTTGTSFTADGLQASSTNGRGDATTYSYDALSRLVRTEDPLGRSTTFAYDRVGNLISRTDAAGNITTYDYDAAGEPTHIGYTDGTAPVAYSYDVDGRRIGMTDGTGTSSYEYDSLGRLIAKRDGSGQQVAYTYDLAGRITGLTYPNGKAVKRRYDPVGHLVSVTDWNSNTSAFGYDADGDLTSIAYPNGVVEANSFDRAGRLSRLTDSAASRTLADYSYGRDAVGDLTTATASGSAASPTESYTYTTLNQLHGFTAGSTSGTFGYDRAGDPTQLADGTALTYDRAQQLVSSTTPGGAVTHYSQDRQGNLTLIDPSNSTQTHLGYDQANRLTSYTTASVDANYRYDGDGRRTSKTVNGKVTNFVYDTMTGASPVLLSDGTHFFVYGPADLPIEQIGSGGATIKLIDTATAIDDSPGKATSMTVQFTHLPRAGDQILLIINCASNQQPSAPDGYATVTTVKSANSSEVTVVYRRTATGNEAGATVPFVNGNPPHPKTLTSLIYSGVDPNQPIDGLSSAISNGRQSRITTPSVSTAGDHDEIVLIENALDTPANSGWSNPAEMSTRATVRDSRVISAVADRPMASAGSTGPITATLDHQAQLEAVTLALRGGAGTQYFQHDQQGSTRILTSADGSVNATYTYNPYGVTTSHTGTGDTPLCYDGQYMDTESGFYYLQARYYDPAIAQFVSRDPLEASTGTPYSYADDNPLTFSDPTGLAFRLSPAEAAASAQIKQAWVFFTEVAKYPVIMAAALLGNLLVESGAANLPTHADNGLGCHGIVQWCRGRWINEGNFAKTVPGGRYKLEVQLEFVQHELGTTYRTYCRTIRDDARAGNLDQATLDVARLYEGAVNGDGSLQDPDDRVHDAHSVYTAYLRGAFG